MELHRCVTGPRGPLRHLDGSPTDLGRLLFTACSLVIEVIPSPEEDPVQHFLGQFSCARILLPQRNVSTPKRGLPRR
jgi:hypothetical protein